MQLSAWAVNAIAVASMHIIRIVLSQTSQKYPIYYVSLIKRELLFYP